MKKIMLLRGLCLIFASSMLLVGCGGGGAGGDGVVGTGFGPDGSSIHVDGAAQKGPYLKGSEVLVSTLSATGVPSTDTALSEIQDDMGTFAFNVAAPGPVIIAADGYHFNEITGSLSQGRLLLRAVYNATADAQQKAYVNVLTHLSYKRTLALLAQGVAVADAIHQAEAEVLQALRTVLPVTDVTDFTALSIYNTDTSHALGNAYMLALSATVYEAAMLRQQQNPQSSVDAQLTAVLNTISDDIADDGNVANNTLLSELLNASHQVRPDQVRANLEDRSLAIVGQKLPVADLDLFLDTDGDGVINAQDGDDDNDGIADAEDASPYDYSEAPVLVPNAATGGVASKTPFTLEWTTSEYAKQIEVQLAKDDVFADIVLDELAPTKQHSFTLDAGIYYVRARAQNELGGWGPWSLATELPVDAFARAFVFSGLAEIYPLAHIQTQDGGVVVLGSATDPTGTGNRVAALMKIDSSGAVVWRKYTRIEWSRELRELENGNLVLLSGNGDGLYLNLFDAAGNEVGQSEPLVTESFFNEKLAAASVVVYSGPRDHFDSGFFDAFAGIFFTLIEPDGIVVGVNKVFAERLADGSARTQNIPILVKLDLTGHVVWRFALGVGDVLTGFWKADDGNYGFTAYASNKGLLLKNRPFDAHFLAKLGPDGAGFAEVSRTQIEKIDANGYEVYGVSLPDHGGGYLLASKDRDGSVYRISSAGEKTYQRSESGLCDCGPSFDSAFFNPSFFIESDVLTYGGPPYSSDGTIAVTRMNVDTGTRINSRVYKPNLAQLGMGSYLFAFTPATNGGLSILGSLYQAENYTGFVLIKTDPNGNAPKTLLQTITVTP